MKKRWDSLFQKQGILQHAAWVRGICLLLFLFGSTSLMAQSVPTFTMDFKDSSLTEIFDYFTAHSEYVFTYNSAEVRQQEVKINASFRDATLSEILTECLKDTPFTFEIIDQHVVIKKRPKPLAEALTLQGTVYDEGNQPLPGVTVILKGTTLGTATDIDGKYTLTLPGNTPNPVLLFSFVGMKTQEISVGGRSTIDVTMETDAAEMDEVVVTGIFTKARESYTGAVTTITEKELKMFRGQNMLATLSNIDPAFNIVANNALGSNPNALPEINIRGNSSLPMSMDELNSETSQRLNQPLIIMDGFEISLEKLMDFNDEEIASINILKDASATAIYGSRGANGVVVITTKRPAPGKLKVFAKAAISLEMPDLSSYDLLNAKDKLALEKEVGLYENTSGESDPHKEQELEEKYNATLRDVLRGVDTYWLSEPVRVGVGQKYNVRLEGGTEELRWGGGVSYNSVQGAMKGSSRNTFSATINLAYTYKNVLFQNQTLLDYNRAKESKYGSFSQYALMNPYWAPKDDEGNIIDSYETISGRTIANPLYDASLNSKNESKYDQVTNNFSVEWRIIEGLTFRGQVGITRQHNSRDVFVPAENTEFNTTQEWAQPENYFRKGRYTYTVGENSSLESRVTLSYTKTFAERHQLYAGIDWSLLNAKTNAYTVVGEGFSNSDQAYFANALQYQLNGRPTGTESTTRQVGFTANVNYTYDNRYYADLSFRTDGSSQFGSNKRFAPFYSVGIGWNIHRENFMAGQSVVNNFRLRGSYGKTGSQQFSSYQALRTYQYYTSDRYMVWNGAELMGFGNDDLEWQITDQFDLGVELGLWNNRISLTFDAYHKKTSNLLSQMDVPLANGFSSYTANVGEVKNVGFETSLSVYPIRDTERELVWMLTGKLAYTKNEITKLSDAIKAQNEEYKKQDVEVNNLLYEGYSQYAIYAVPSLGIDPSTGNELYLDEDGNVTDEWHASAKQYFGQTEPKFRGNINSLLQWKDLSLNLNFGFQWGSQQYNETLLNKVEVTNDEIQLNVDRRVWTERWQKPGDVKPYKGYGDYETKTSSRFVMDESVFELQSANLQYRWHTPFVKKLKLETINFDVNMSDLFYISSIKRERGTDYPFARRMEFSVSFMF